ncbi:MAG TPA: ATP-binding protein [Bacteroidota bacterium]|nr:ATP-binding protein [Bacteroidota bacterium]
MNAQSSFHCTPEKVKEIRNWIADTLIDTGIHADIVNRVLLASSEAVTNCIVHGYKPAREGRVDVSLEIDGSTIRLNIRDYGIGMRMDQYDSPDTDIASEGGYGIYLIRSLMDDVQLIQQPVGTELKMSISTKQAQST